MKFFDNNPRKISKQQFEGLVADLDEFGDLGGVVHDEDSDQVISANQRCRAFDINKMQPVITEQLDIPNRQGTIARGYVEWHGEKFSYRRVRWTPEKCKAANIIANVAGGSWDWDILSNSWDADLLKSVGFDDDLLRDWQQNSIALGEMLAAEGGGDEGGDTEPQVTEVEAEKYHKKWGAGAGEIWQVGEHIIACLDSLQEDNVRRVVGDNAINFVFADPPYGINIVTSNGYVGGGEAYDIPFGGVKSNHHHRRIPVGGGDLHKEKTGHYYIESYNKGFGSTYGAKPFGSKKANVTGSDRASNIVGVGKYYPVFGDDTTETAKASVSMLLRMYPEACHVWWGANYYTDALSPSPCWVIWDKDNTGNFADCEMAWTNQPTAARIFEHRWNGMLKASEQGQRRIHPTQKPIELAKYCLAEYGNDGDIILDPFCGSGITLLAAQELGNRKVIAFELEPVYISVVLERMQQKFNIQPITVGGGTIKN